MIVFSQYQKNQLLFKRCLSSGVNCLGGKRLAVYDQTGACVKNYIYMGSTNHPTLKGEDQICLSLVGNKLLSEYQPLTGAKYYYTSDQINSTRIVTDSSGAIVSSSLYDPYGGVQKVWVDSYHPKLGVICQTDITTIPKLDIV